MGFRPDDKQKAEAFDRVSAALIRSERENAALRKELATIRAAAPWSEADESLLTRLRSEEGAAFRPEVDHLLAIIDRFHDEGCWLRTLLEEKCRDLGLIAQDGLGWREMGWREAISAVRDWLKLCHPSTTWAGLHEELANLEGSLPPLLPPSASRKRGDEAVALLRRLTQADDLPAWNQGWVDTRDFFAREDGGATP